MDSNVDIRDSSATSCDDMAPIYNEGNIVSDVDITTIDGDVKNVYYGDNIKLTGTVSTSGIPVAGQMLTFTVNGKSLTAYSDVKGLYSIDYTVDFIGKKNVVATYKGSTGAETLNMGKLISDKANVTVTVDDVKGKAGEKVKFTAKVTDANGKPVKSGTVIFGFNGKEYKANVENGIATVEVVLPKAGTYSATAYYEGDDTYNSNYTVFTVEVSDIPNPNPDPNKKGIPMEATGNPLLVLLVALVTVGLGSLKRRL